jgi:hypothetical protein
VASNRCCRVGHAASVLVRFVDEVGTDLVVLGYQGHSRIAQFVTGTTAHNKYVGERQATEVEDPAPGARVERLLGSVGDVPRPTQIAGAIVVDRRR